MPAQGDICKWRLQQFYGVLTIATVVATRKLRSRRTGSLQWLQLACRHGKTLLTAVAFGVFRASWVALVVGFFFLCVCVSVYEVLMKWKGQFADLSIIQLYKTQRQPFFSHNWPGTVKKKKKNLVALLRWNSYCVTIGDQFGSAAHQKKFWNRKAAVWREKSCQSWTFLASQHAALSRRRTS